jgi:uncharacterized membrane protein
MSRSRTWVRSHIVWVDVLAAVLLAGVFKLVAPWIDWAVLLDKDTFAIILGLAGGLSAVAYLGFLDTGRAKIRRLKASRQFKNIMLIMCGSG